MKVAIAKETYPGERRVALVPANIAQLHKVGLQILVESGAGLEAGFPDSEYESKGARLVESRDELFESDIVLQVRALGANPEAGRADLPRMRRGLTLIGGCDPLGNPQAVADVAGTGAKLFALEMVPRITRAQSMDVLSSMATIAGYRAVLLAAVELPRMFPMMTTAAGTLIAARVFVIGAGVAGLQACATAKRLGGVVRAYDVRPACREQVESVGAKFVRLELDAGQAEDQGGYAKAMDEEFYRRQRELMAEVVAESDVVITTAAIPGKQSPLLVTAAAVEGMAPGSVIVDLAAERGGNCEVSQPDQKVVHQHVTVLGPTNLSAEAPYHASQMLSNNVTRFLLNMIQDGKLNLNLEDEIIADTLVAADGEVRSNRIRQLLGLAPIEPPPSEAGESAPPSPSEAGESAPPPPDEAESESPPPDEAESESPPLDEADSPTQEQENASDPEGVEKEQQS